KTAAHSSASGPGMRGATGWQHPRTRRGIASRVGVSVAPTMVRLYGLTTIDARRRAMGITASDQAEGDRVREAVRERYASAANAVTSRGVAAEPVLPTTAAGTSCCDGAAACTDSCCSPGAPADVSRALYSIDEVSALPPDAVLASLGCGNPTALAELKPGEVVLDLGSGGGIDVLLSARRVGPTGLAYGVDMTDEMLELAARNAAQAQATNVKFLKGTIAEVPLPAASVDVG